VQVPLPVNADETARVVDTCRVADFRDVIFMLHGIGNSAISAAKAAAAALARLRTLG
jgi:hypothetical protein